MACEAQGADGCFRVPIRFPRSQLTEEEQSLTSPAIPLSGVGGELVLQFDYVPFSIGERYVRVIQGFESKDWPRLKQEVRVQLCASNCDREGSWTDASQTNGASARFPEDKERGNALSMGNQTGLDWRSGRTFVSIPEAFRTTAFRFRFVPELEEDARVGLDNILIRRLR